MKKLIGDKKFYQMVLAIAVPIMIQSGITSFVGLIDNIMVGQVGTDSMSGVAIVNQLLFVFNLCIFGGISGAGIFTAQFFGQENHEGVRDTFRFKIIICAMITAIAILIFGTCGSSLIALYLHEGSSSGDIGNTLTYGEEYLRIMLIGLIPFAISQAYCGTLRETGETIVPMKAGIAAVLVNLVLNYLLIFGHFGFPKLGIAGAAIGTIIARFIECLIVVVWTHRHHEKNPFIQGAYKTLRVPLALTNKIIIKGMPLLLNEGLWAGGMAVLMQCYSVRGLSVVAGINIANTIANLFNIVFLALGNAVAIIVGPLLGAGKMDEAKETAYKMIFFSVCCCLILGGVMVVVAPAFPMLYNTTDEVKDLAAWFIRIAAICMPIYGFLHATYFTLRSGGKTIITFIFDSVYLWLVSIPLAFMLAYYTGINILVVYLMCQLVDIFKCILGYVLLRKGIWIQNLVTD
ncbi:MATE family efflux transporter [Niameybacter massiliensis]|uniref:Probable multidrug resistance protein NorM n=1 Tax=Holtiella tumoricola TaxID=3018743 RepID=A0AA42J1T8_9FIRM|nr:MATE family efflux transporter [Holtiella tumoricola]MDA3732947.1 MATE family efflux transporter [Holtiella tumoricola]